MLGAFIGDLAANAWETDKDLFYSQLINTRMKPSCYGYSILNAASFRFLHTKYDDTLRINNPCSLENSGKWLMWQIVFWNANDEVNKMLSQFHQMEKEEVYAKMFINEILAALYNGATKNDIMLKDNAFTCLIKHWNWNKPGEYMYDSLLCYIFRAWNSFYRGFDFTSSIHNAMLWSGDKHLCASITGAFAEAMYGCRYNMIKKKYAFNGNIRYKYELLPIAISNGYTEELFYIMGRESLNKRTFIPKNNTLSNVEFHNWYLTDNFLEDTNFSNKQYYKIFKSEHTFDAKYGLYMENGWVYVYSNELVLGRLLFKQVEDRWNIVCIQLSEEGNMKELKTILSAIL